MKKFFKAMWGVTLLEIMLVLAIAALIIVMSIKYYQSATSSAQANEVIQKLAAITAAADNLSRFSGSYSAVTSGSIKSLLSSVQGLNLPWGGAITITIGTGQSYGVSLKAPPGVCGIILGNLQGNDNITITASCGTDNTIAYTYTMQGKPKTTT